MVSKASTDLPEPESPVNTTSLSRGIESVTFFRLCSRAPRTVMWSMGNAYLFLFSSYRKRRATGGHQLPIHPLDPALGHNRAPPRVNHSPRRAQRLADLDRGDEVELQVEAHGPNDARLHRSHRPAHGRIGKGTDHPTMHKAGVVGHVVRRFHLDRGRTLTRLNC